VTHGNRTQEADGSIPFSSTTSFGTFSAAGRFGSKRFAFRSGAGLRVAAGAGAALAAGDARPVYEEAAALRVALHRSAAGRAALAAPGALAARRRARAGAVLADAGAAIFCGRAGAPELLAALAELAYARATVVGRRARGAVGHAAEPGDVTGARAAVRVGGAHPLERRAAGTAGRTRQPLAARRACAARALRARAADARKALAGAVAALVQIVARPSRALARTTAAPAAVEAAAALDAVVADGAAGAAAGAILAAAAAAVGGRPGARNAA